MTKTVLITGANRGLGRETAIQLSQPGYALVLTARDPRGLEDLDLPLTTRLALDVSSPGDIERFLNELKDRRTQIDVLINNAGVSLDHFAAPFEVDAQTLQQTFATNTFGPFLLCQGLLPEMLQRNYGRIVNVSSRMGHLEGFKSTAPAYRLSKHSLNGITKIFSQLALEQDRDVLVNSVCPGWVRSKMGGPDAPLSLSEGAEGIVWAATLPALGPNGKFFSQRAEIANF